MVTLLRENLTQSFAAGAFGVSQSTVSRRWDLLRPLIAPVLVDGTLVPTWDWKHRSDLYNKKRGDHGINPQVARNRSGHRLVTVGDPGPVTTPTPDTPPGLAARLAGLGVLGVLGDLGDIGRGLTTGTRTPPGGQPSENRSQANHALAVFRAQMEHILAHLKNWKILSHRYRGPLDKIGEVIHAVVALRFFRNVF